MRANRCNHCTLRDLRALYGDSNVTVRAEPVGDARLWIAVRVAGEPEPVALFSALSAHCVC